MAERPLDPANEPDDAQLGAIARHALHDEELIAAFAAGDVEAGPDEVRVRSFVDRCATCREIHADLALVRGALQSMTASAATAFAAAPRDFRLTAAQAATLRPDLQLRASAPVERAAVAPAPAAPAPAAPAASAPAPSAPAAATPLPLRSLGARIAAAISGFGRPLGATLATFGLVGVLLGSVGSFGPAAGAGHVPTAAEAASQAPAGPGDVQAPGPTHSVDRNLASPVPKESSMGVMSGDEGSDPLASTPEPRVLLLGASTGALVAGVVLLAWTERRRRRNPA